MVGTCSFASLPCVFCSSGRQWQCAAAGPAAGDAGSCSPGEVVDRDMGQAGEEPGSIPQVLGGGRVAEAGGDARPCPGEDLVVPVLEEEGEMNSSGGGEG
jgi:hypothetical protein